MLAGTGTILADDPRLTARPDRQSADTTLEQPLRAVFGTTDIPADAAVLDDAAETVLLRTRSASDALAQLHQRGVTSVLIEGGPGVAATFLEAGLVDEVISYVAPVLLGAGPAAVGDIGVTTIGSALRGVIVDVGTVGAGADRCVRITTRIGTVADPVPAVGPGRRRQHHHPHDEGDH